MLLGSIRLSRFLPKILKYLLNHFRIFNTGNDFDLANTVFADFNVDIENSLQSLHPSHSAVSLCRTLVLPVGIGWFSNELLTALGRRHLNPSLTFGRKDSMEPREGDVRLGYQRSKFVHELRRLKEHMGGAIAIVL